MHSFYRCCSPSLYHRHTLTNTWQCWTAILLCCRLPADAPSFEVMVPMADAVRVKSIASSLALGLVPTLLVGGVELGSGKTMLTSVVQGLPNSSGAITINLSAQTSSNALQDTLRASMNDKPGWALCSCLSHNISLTSLAARACHNRATG